MKKLLAFIVASVSAVAVADIRGVSILSFRAAGQRPQTLMAELCGHIDSDDIHRTRALVVVDNNDRSYTAIPDPSGNFCISILTYNGQVRLYGQSLPTGRIEILPIKGGIEGTLD